MAESSARDLAATEKARAWLATWDEKEDARVGGVAAPIRCRIVYDLANAYDALEKQAADAQASERAEKHVARAMRDVMAERDDAKQAVVDAMRSGSEQADEANAWRARGLRAEEALRLGQAFVATTSYYRQRVESRVEFEAFAVALAAAGADTPTCICYPGHHDMPGGREPACPAP